ncbi:GNAT family N-acetyltransferase [Shewanella sp. Isolate11]|uniref:GNAT family N-acetyltransferase n=1 Tax=Shewanella sp. Isolate11 TaxID=2908530 RepID=UPI001EFD8A88|nr:GNAT family N-acetyltransferase [Shewanella sp. Isolate11]MCG9697217.1 GNAT family N-acetyltransferase [Shewanella sp. Isolate11]
MMKPIFKIIPYESDYALQVSRLYHQAIQHIDIDLYTTEQKLAWSRAPRSVYHWNKRLSKSKAWLMLDTSRQLDGRFVCVGFINVESHFYRRGYIDSLYVLPEYQGNKVATLLCQQVQIWAQQAGLPRLFVDASKLSKDLFLSQGFKLQHNRYQEKCGQVFHMFYLSKDF